MMRLTTLAFCAVLRPGCFDGLGGGAPSGTPAVQGGAPGDDEPAEPDCSGLDEPTCQASQVCTAVYAVNVANESLFGGCAYVSADDTFRDEPTCGEVAEQRPGVRPECLRFFNSLLPDGWTEKSCSDPRCPSF